MTNDHVRWRTIADGPLPHRRWDGDYVVFNPASGSTHILDIVSGEVLASLFAGACETKQLRARIAEFLDVPDDESLAANIDRVLDVLEELGLVEPDVC